MTDHDLSALLHTPEARQAMRHAAEQDAARIHRQHGVRALVAEHNGAFYAVVMGTAYLRVRRSLRIAQYGLLGAAACIVAVAVLCLWVIGGRG